MKLAKSNVLVIDIAVSRVDSSGNRYSRVYKAGIIKPSKNVIKDVEVDTRVEYHSSCEQVVKEFLMSHFDMGVRYLSEHKNIVIREIEVSYRELNNI